MRIIFTSNPVAIFAYSFYTGFIKTIYKIIRSPLALTATIKKIPHQIKNHPRQPTKKLTTPIKTTLPPNIMAKKKSNRQKQNLKSPTNGQGITQGLQGESLLIDVNYSAGLEKLSQFYYRYQKPLFALLAFLLLAILFIIGFGIYQKNQIKYISEEFYQITSQPNPETLIDFATRNASGAGAGYGALASMMALDMLAKNQNPNLQKKLENTIAENRHLKNISNLQNGNEKTLRRLKVAGGAGQNISLTNLALADRLTQKGKMAEAKKLLQQISINNKNNLLGIFTLQLLPAY
ncbi:MAG: hypothetical protein ACR2NY_05775 [Alphaproteobacteria bacterium]